MAEFRDREAYAVSHLGWGLNPRARWSQLALLDKHQTNGSDGRAKRVVHTGAADIAYRSQVVRSRRQRDSVHRQVRLFITPATQAISAKAAEEGLLDIFANAGAIVTAPGCGPCAAGRIGPLAPGEVSINTGTRNDPGRLGPADAQI